MSESKPHITVVTPVYGCTGSLEELYNRLVQVLGKINDNFEIIMVNDASPDDAWLVIEQLSQKDPRVKGINLSRNFGQHPAISAGIDYAKGQWIAVMDCDLQDVPEEITKMYNLAQKGYDIVVGRRIHRNDSFIKKLYSAVFYKVYAYFTGSEVNRAVANFSIISSKVAKAFRGLREQSRFYPVFINWLGFNKAYIDVVHDERLHGKSSYSFRKLWDLAIDTLTSQSNKFLRLSIKFGFFMSLLSALIGAWLIIKFLLFNNPVEGWTSVMVSIFFVAGLLFSNLGFIGLYLGKVFDETKRRPIYVVKETTFNKAN